MLVDGAKFGDVEIPVFCYEPKLGQPVGACRMCLVEIEGIPKLQTGCSTPVKDGMVVHTQTDRVKEAQQAVVEFLLINHPLDCPVCDKGGECPLQDISFGWGGGRSRFIEPKRHFEKPLELSPLVAIDRERCILCYRCVRFSQEVSEDYQLVFQERGAHTFVGTFDGHPYVAPFSGNIIELCPVGALTSQPYRFRARPWDIEGAGGVCTLCPGQCNVTFTVRDERVLRVLARDNAEVDDGWLCDRGRFAYQAIHVDERITAADGPRRRRAAPRLLGARAGRGRGRPAPRRRASVGVLAGGGTSNEEGFLLQKIVARRPGHRRPRLARLRRRRSRRHAGAARPRAAGDGRRPGVRPHRPGARRRAGRRHADPRPADPQGRAPPPRQPRGRDRAAVVAGRQRQAGRALRAGRRGAGRGADRGRAAAASGADVPEQLAELGRAAARRRRGRRDPLRRARARRSGGRRRARRHRRRAEPPRPRRRGPARRAVQRQRPRPARGRRPALRRPGPRARRPARSRAPPRSPPPPPRASSPRCGSSAPTRWRPTRTARPGTRAWSAPRRSSPTPAT